MFRRVWYYRLSRQWLWITLLYKVWRRSDWYKFTGFWKGLMPVFYASILKMEATLIFKILWYVIVPVWQTVNWNSTARWKERFFIRWERTKRVKINWCILSALRVYLLFETTHCILSKEMFILFLILI